MQAYSQAAPPLDLPQSHPTVYTLPDPPVAQDIENGAVNYLIELLLLARNELARGPSARLMTGLDQFDSQRIARLIEKADAFLDDYVANSYPLDMPESQPRSPGVEPGRGGMGPARA